MSETNASISIEAKVAEAIAAVGFVPAALLGALQGWSADTVNHHKRKVLQLAAQSFDAKDRARRMIASRLFGYGSKKGVDTIEEIEGQSFLASRSDVAQLTAEALEAFEKGASITTSEAMAIPIGSGPGSGRPFTGVFANVPIWRGKLGKGEKGIATSNRLAQFDFIRGDDGKTYIVDNRERSIRRLSRNGQSGDVVGGRQQAGKIVGILVKRRQQRRRLGFMQAWEAVWPKQEAKLDAVLDLALTEAGRAKLQGQTNARREGNDAGREAFTQFLSANPGKYAAARKVADAARKAVRARYSEGDKR